VSDCKSGRRVSPPAINHVAIRRISLGSGHGPSIAADPARDKRVSRSSILERLPLSNVRKLHDVVYWRATSCGVALPLMMSKATAALHADVDHRISSGCPDPAPTASN
jgi:hypothetical protein